MSIKASEIYVNTHTGRAGQFQEMVLRNLGAKSNIFEGAVTIGHG
jgi:hypothetical protein